MSYKSGYSTTRLYKIQRTNLPGFKNLAGLYLTKSGKAIKTLTNKTSEVLKTSEVYTKDALLVQTQFYALSFPRSSALSDTQIFK